MSGPNTNYDPVEVAALAPEAVQGALDAALDAVAAAATLDALCEIAASSELAPTYPPGELDYYL